MYNGYNMIKYSPFRCNKAKYETLSLKWLIGSLY